ncbi:MAG: SUMF1/EgtB/PvdO family nonheme iron enzyme [Victivallales bacterium]|nr:SUMF1/EgtB/PvdO family nonheme iron enzyme [Victivallales bacterium]
MNKHRFLRLAFIFHFVLPVIACFNAMALDEKPSAVFEYTVADNQITITGVVECSKELSIPSTIDGMPVTAIGNRAFSNRQDITTITIPESVATIGDDAMVGCKSLESIHVNESNPYYATEDGVLFSKDKSTLIAYPSGKKDKYVAIPDGVTSINKNAFDDCSSIQCIALPNSCILLSNCFSGCNQLVSVQVDADNSHYTSIDGVLFSKSMKELVLYPAGKPEESYSIPNGIETIKEHAFANAGNLTTVILPASVQAIGEDAFTGCTALKELVFMGSKPSFYLLDGDIRCFDSPATFFVPQGKGWEDFETAGVTLEFRNQMKQTLELRKGWNLCALAITPDDDSLGILKGLEKPWTWSNAHFRQQDTFIPGQGFWIYAHEDIRLTLTGDKAYPKPMYAGWNLLGVMDEAKTVDLAANPNVWRWNQNHYEQVNGGLPQGSTYWIYQPAAVTSQISYLLQPADGMWRIDKGEWNAGGSVVKTKTGIHGITFRDVAGYVAPPSQVVNLVDGQMLVNTVSYMPVPPSVTYTLNPPDGKWRIDNGDWNDSGATVETTVGKHTVSFQAVTGYTAPSAQNITLTAGESLSKDVEYKPIQPTVKYTLTPTNGKWRLDDGDWIDSGKTVTTTAGEHMVSFQAVEGYTTPVDQTITLAFGDKLSKTVVYDVIPPTVTYTLNPADGKWCLDDGDWNDSGATVEATVGSHKVSFMEVEGYNTPSEQTLFLAAGGMVERTVNYTVIAPTVSYTLVPENGKWRLDNGSWNNSGATVTTMVGKHTIHFSAVDGYTTPDSQDIVLSAGENLSRTVEYETIQPTVTYTLSPSNGKWSLDNGVWNTSGTTVTTTVGTHSVSFQAVNNYITPAKQDITLTAGERLTKLVAYEPVPPTVTYTLNPPSGKWRIDDGEWNASGVMVTTTVGEHTISFMDILGYLAPNEQNISLTAGETYHNSEVYEKHETLYVVIDLSSGPESNSYPVRGTDTPPDLNDDTCRTTELWLRRIPAGTFIMGTPKTEYGRQPYSSNYELQHEVTITQDFYIGVFECTQRQWEMVMGTRPSYFSNQDYYATRPVEKVSYGMIRGSSSVDEGWPRCGHIVQDLSFMERLQLKTGLIFDLPTEAQWEYACRAGTTTALNSGNNLSQSTVAYYLTEVGRCGYNSGSIAGSSGEQDWTDAKGTAKVGSYLPNAWGLYDMHGNVLEWCLDWQADFNENPVTDPVGPFYGAARVARGGSWRETETYSRSASRLSYSSSYGASNTMGFRIACLHNSSPIVNCILNISGGKWRLDDDEWNESKLSVTTTVGEHVISYKDVEMPGYNTPLEQRVIFDMGRVYKRIDDYMRNENEYIVIDLSSGPNSEKYPVRWSNTPPNLDDDKCRTTELWLRRIKAGMFIMGSPDDELGREQSTETLHKVVLTQDYFIGVFEITQRQWELVMATKPSYFKNTDYYLTRPVENITFDMICGKNVDSLSFMGKLQSRTGLVFDLPTEAQWEYACRAGTMTALNSGQNLKSSFEDSNMTEMGRYKHNGGGNSYNYFSSDSSTDKGTAKVGCYMPNAWGLYDMHGNVSEFCRDYDTPSDYIADIITIDPFVSASGTGYTKYFLRGGSYYSDAKDCRSASRRWVKEVRIWSGTYENNGFRIVYLP